MSKPTERDKIYLQDIASDEEAYSSEFESYITTTEAEDDDSSPESSSHEIESSRPETTTSSRPKTSLSRRRPRTTKSRRKLRLKSGRVRKPGSKGGGDGVSISQSMAELEVTSDSMGLLERRRMMAMSKSKSSNDLYVLKPKRLPPSPGKLFILLPHQIKDKDII